MPKKNVGKFGEAFFFFFQGAKRPELTDVIKNGGGLYNSGFKRKKKNGTFRELRLEIELKK